MKILLIEPPKSPLTIGGEDIFLYEPLALEYLAAGVSDKHDVTILDLRLEKDLKRVFNNFHPDIVGISSYTVHVNTVKRLFEEIKGWNPNILTVVGGHHATVAPEDFKTPFIDLIVKGEGVFAFNKIVERYDIGEDFDGIPGVAFSRGDRLIMTDNDIIEDLDILPFPDRKLTAKHRRHYYSEWMKPLASIRTSKGCPNRCSFCALWKLAGGRYLKRKPEKVIEELAGIAEDFVFFADDESLVDAKRMQALAKLIKESGIKKQYFLYARSDTIVKNQNLLALWREIGLIRVFVGFEFFRDEDLNYINKGSMAQDNETAVKILQNLGIEIYASFIVRPEFNREDFAAFGNYCRSLELNFASFSVLTPLPGTDLYEEVKDQMITHNYDLFDFIHTLLPTTLSMKDFYEEYYKLFKNAISFKNSISLLKKYPLKEIIPTLVKSYQVLKKLRTAYKDYNYPR